MIFIFWKAYQIFSATSAVAHMLLAKDTKAAASPIDVLPYVGIISESLSLYIIALEPKKLVSEAMLAMFRPKVVARRIEPKIRIERVLSHTMHIRQRTTESLMTA